MPTRRLLTRPAALFRTTIFLGSLLLFLIEPVAGKRLLPLLGGSAAVWTACLVFFQTSLLLGYLCAHLLATRVEARAQSTWYLALLGAALLQIVAVFSRSLTASTVHPIWSVFWLLGAIIGLPFLALAAASPLLQTWYSRSRPGSTTISPFHLYAVSNAGSLLALMSYPVVIEPYLSLGVQLVGWSFGFFVFMLLCGAVHAHNRRALATEMQEDRAVESATPPAAVDRVFWILLPACASLLLCAVTSYLSQNVAAVPLLWILPLTLYLLSFIATFTGGRAWPRWVTFSLLAMALGSVSYVLYSYEEYALRLAVIPIYCGVLFLASLFCHGELYRLRPAPRDATTFYLCVSAGGAAGAFFVGVFAPVVFAGNYELFVGLVVVSALAAALAWRQRPVWWALPWGAMTGVVIVLFVQQAELETRGTVVHTRNFYGTLRVVSAPYGTGTESLRFLYNGAVKHGMQHYGSGRRSAPNTYYGPTSGVGLAIRRCCEDRSRRVGVIGLGAGTLAAYGRPGDVFRFYEINPQVERIAREQFSYLSESEADVQVILGDARMSLAQEPSQRFDVLAVDAFSGDAIPVHLLTMQAIELYRRHLAPNGILAMHVTNRYLDLAPVVEQLADRAGLQSVLVTSLPDLVDDLDRADWVLVAAAADLLPGSGTGAIFEQPHPPPRHLRLWTDDYSSLLPIVRWQPRANVF